ncbi:MAG TPA: HAD-IB family hydrolase [Polyangiaceae bacterium]|nr:HAD-IB family hydrolase [Polyangiaceae bacterium]
MDAIQEPPLFWVAHVDPMRARKSAPQTMAENSTPKNSQFERGDPESHPAAVRKHEERRRAALFDMDKTLLSANTAWLYTQHRRRQGEVGLRELARVSYWLLQYSMGIVDAERIARTALRDYAGRAASALAQTSDSWFKEHVRGYVRERARGVVEAHRRAGDHLAIVTGATRYAAEPLARELGIDHVVCSELEVDSEGRLTGLPNDPICYGVGKLQRTEQLASRLGFRIEEAAFYSDSITDLPLLERVGTPVAVCPDRRLRSLARRRGWRVEEW